MQREAVKANLSPRGWATRLGDVCDMGVVVLGEDERLDFASARARSLLGAESEEQLDERWTHVKRQIQSRLHEARSQLPVALEAVAATQSSSTPNLTVHVYGLDEPDCAGYLLLLQRADRAAAIERSQRHAAHSRAIMSLARDTAHDLKDVLNVISMNFELLSHAANSGGHEGESRYAGRCAEVIRRELKRLDQSIDAVLGRDMQEGELPRTFDVAAMCRTLIGLVGARASRQHVDLRSAIESSADVRGFPDRLRGALLSLLVNALDAMPDGGTLSLSVTKTATIQIRLCDSGPGIASDRLSDIWRLHFTTKALGTGLGLSVARATIEGHGGTIRYQPNPNGGSCFSIELPSAINN